jgi:L-lysine 2,3-aminomutase
MRRSRTSRASLRFGKSFSPAAIRFCFQRAACARSPRLAAIPHVKIIRWHTRIPAVDPLRVTPDLVEALRVDGATTYVVLHTNHARELTEQARARLRGSSIAACRCSAQTVLLKGVNDNVETLEALMRARGSAGEAVLSASPR